FPVSNIVLCLYISLLVVVSLYLFHSFLNSPLFFSFFFNAPATTEIYTLSLHDALPISRCARSRGKQPPTWLVVASSRGSHRRPRSEEHTSELQSRENLVCRLLLEKKKKKKKNNNSQQ